MKNIWLRLLIGTLGSEALPIALLIALVATLGPGTTEGDQEFATRLGDWVGPAGGALATFLLATWVVRPLTHRHVFFGAALGLLVALLDAGIIAGSGSPFRWLFALSGAARVLAGSLGGWVGGLVDREPR